MADLRQSHKGSESSQMDQRIKVGGAFYTRFRAFEACGLLPGYAASTYQKHGVPTKIYAVRLDSWVVASQTGHRGRRVSTLEIFHVFMSIWYVF